MMEFHGTISCLSRPYDIAYTDALLMGHIMLGNILGDDHHSTSDMLAFLNGIEFAKAI
jgi:hypothetical protein